MKARQYSQQALPGRHHSPEPFRPERDRKVLGSIYELIDGY